MATCAEQSTRLALWAFPQTVPWVASFCLHQYPEHRREGALFFAVAESSPMLLRAIAWADPHSCWQLEAMIMYNPDTPSTPTGGSFPLERLPSCVDLDDIVSSFVMNAGLPTVRGARLFRKQQYDMIMDSNNWQATKDDRLVVWKLERPVDGVFSEPVPQTTCPHSDAAGPEDIAAEIHSWDEDSGAFFPQKTQASSEALAAELRS